MEKQQQDLIYTACHMLNMLGQCTGDVYLLYDLEKNRIYFSDNIKTADDLFAVKGSVCSLEQWREWVDSRDICRLQKTFESLFSGKTDHYNLNYRVKNRKNESHWINSRGKVFPGDSGKPQYVVGRLSAAAPSNQTGLFRNRELKQEMRAILASLQPAYLLLIGIDNLKAINLKNGLDFGDAVLHDVSQVIHDETHHMREVYRVNGDWFAVNLPMATAPQVTELFDRVQERLCGQCTVSGGCVSYTDYHVSDEGILLQYAEISLDHSKAHGKNMLTFFTPEDYENKLRELELREDLERSIASGFQGFEMYYQPQVYSETYELYGAEALLRYHSPRRGIISPAEFVPILEQGDMIYTVGLWVLSQALEACRKWRPLFPDFHISVNMSYRQLDQDSIEDDVLSLLKQSGVPGSALTIEITESMQLVNYTQLNGFFHRWKKNGIEISVDDFGTGYSSLGRLKEMSVDEIKIDRCFVRDIQNSAYNYRLLSNIIELADSSQIRVCCEGVETPEELQVIDDLHPALMQGFLFAKPCSADEFAKRFIITGQERAEKAKLFRKKIQSAKQCQAETEPVDEIAQTILNAENDIFYLSDMDTYELYYLNPAGQKTFGVKNYHGRKCYKVLHGKNSPCSFCTNHLLRQDSFYVWENENEYCGRHFLLKDKIVLHKGKKVRLEVALDITKQEYVSQNAKERLIFAEKIAGYIETLSVPAGLEKAIHQVLASVGDFYRADRAYLFERNLDDPECWDNTYEWCAASISSQKDQLQKIPPDSISRWMDLFEREKSIVILNLMPLRESSPKEWEILHAQGIQRLIAVPIRENNKTLAFVGVDNPRYCIHDDSQVRVLASFLLMRLRQDRSEHRYQVLLQQSNQDLTDALDVGFWTLEIRKTDKQCRMMVNDSMKRIMDMPELDSPLDIYRYWEKGVQQDTMRDIADAFHRMVDTNQLVQLEYTWTSPGREERRFRLSGILMEDSETDVKLKGYCRLLK